MTIAGVGAVETYLQVLGVDPEPPSAAALFRLHRAHVERVAYETVWIHLGERWGIGGSESLERVVRLGRAGYCLHLNGAFSELLRLLGYDVVRHVGGVHGPDGPAEDAMTNHLALTVAGLPTDDHPQGTWYVDVGTGDALHEPLPLRAGAYQQGPFRLELEHTPGGVGDWRLVHDPQGAFVGMAWRSAPAEMEAFAARHLEMSTSPDSGFVRVLSAQRRDAAGVDLLRGLVLRRVGVGAGERTLRSLEELVAVLHDVFRIDLGGVEPAVLDALWARTLAAHREWEAAEGR